MLLQLIANHPEALPQILNGTPTYVWGILAALTVLGLTQARDRTASLTRIAVMPVVMTIMGLWGMFGAFSSSPMFGYAVLAWIASASVMIALVGTMAPPQGASYDAASRTFAVSGSLVPMALILAIFLTKYVVGVETSMNPGLARDGQYSMIVGALYGMFSGIFAGRALRLLRLASRPAMHIAAA
ncbi:MAG: DUF6622 family protein [Pseudomonadota bacterium]